PQLLNCPRHVWRLTHSILPHLDVVARHVMTDPMVSESTPPVSQTVRICPRFPEALQQLLGSRAREVRPEPGRGIWWPGGPNAPGAAARGAREIGGFVGWEMAREKGPPRSGDATGRIRGPHEACFVGWVGARGLVGLLGRSSSPSGSRRS